MSAFSHTEPLPERHPANTTFAYLEKLYLSLQSYADADGVFRGSKTMVYEKIGASSGWYSRLYNLLTTMGCIEVQQKGHRGRPSVVRLIKAPTREEFDMLPLDSRDLTSVPTRGNLDERLRTLEGRLQGIDLGSYLVSLEDRLTNIESRLDMLEGGS